TPISDLGWSSSISTQKSLQPAERPIHRIHASRQQAYETLSHEHAFLNGHGCATHGQVAAAEFLEVQGAC
ncbi:MAG TPA: hypothetical protein PK999_19595, partial [Nitrospira sp.]|nr:hypothetical protein [Nitrospira sp.]